MRKTQLSLLLGAIAATSTSTFSGQTLAANSTDPIKLILNDWTGELLSTRIMGEALKREGIKVDYVQADAMAQFQGLQTGDLHVVMEVWSTTQKDVFDKALKTGKVENLGESGMNAREEWWYPEYMKEKCPGLPDWKALKEPECVKAFSTADTAPKGRYLGAPVTWGGFDEERIAALGLDFEVIHAGTDAALFAELDSAYARKAPIILWIYSPHWAPSVYKGEFVEFPPFTPACYDEKKYDCGKPFGPIWKAAWSGVKDKWPKAHAAISKFNMPTDEMNALIVKVDRDKQPLEDVAAKWLDENEARWKAWFQ
ncbi:ABC transporter substrate-binding protein [Hyphomicrobium facile]|uniref:Glycine betaine/proline transport system substrate-binding protein n=1 Tax=Hyphomicrobium facile TaxID=51670 RepID=A0A1I7N532_9HYPH|nr:ABC transporter substrate-binding protein [Hyphomicrobium facile]SFV29750.1 glycine betaine/proline transport system substrate-binding protein [Hyphomicrobium facile]